MHRLGHSKWGCDPHVSLPRRRFVQQQISSMEITNKRAASVSLLFGSLKHSFSPLKQRDLEIVSFLCCTFATTSSELAVVALLRQLRCIAVQLRCPKCRQSSSPHTKANPVSVFAGITYCSVIRVLHCFENINMAALVYKVDHTNHT